MIGNEMSVAKLNPHNSFKIHIIFSKLDRIVEKDIQNEEKDLELGSVRSVLC